MGHLEDGTARAVIANSGNANACAPYSHEYAERTCASAAEVTGLNKNDFVVASTGVIGQTLNVEAIEAALPALVDGLGSSDAASDAAATAIMTTDTRKKELAVRVEIGGKTVTLGAIAKGSGMIHPIWAPCCASSPPTAPSPHEMLEDALRSVVKRTPSTGSPSTETPPPMICAWCWPTVWPETPSSSGRTRATLPSMPPLRRCAPT